MQTQLAQFMQGAAAGQDAEDILRRCVHCGFCTATCPTYQILGDELDGPRGRIYLIKQVLEGTPTTAKTQMHLDRCLTCRNCETTCPSGVEYGRLLDIGRAVVEHQVRRSWWQALHRRGLHVVLSRAWLFVPLLRVGQALRSVLPKRLAQTIPAPQSAQPWPSLPTTQRSMLLLEGCVQPGIAPNINAACARVFASLGIRLLPTTSGCCGALAHHLSQEQAALVQIKHNIDAWLPALDAGAEAILITASGCGVHIKDYAQLLKHDAAYAAKAARISAAARDIAEVLPAFQHELRALLQPRPLATAPTVFHPPCTLQHGQKIRGAVENLLRGLGVDVRLCADSHTCCGSAGTYSILQPKLSTQLRADKLAKLLAIAPERIVTANIGCQTHLQAGTKVEVTHWVELLDQMIHASGA